MEEGSVHACDAPVVSGGCETLRIKTPAPPRTAHSAQTEGSAHNISSSASCETLSEPSNSESALMSTLALYSKLKESLDVDEIETHKYKTKPYMPPSRNPDALSAVTLPGVSPASAGFRSCATADEVHSKTVGLKDLASWYAQQHDSKKYSLAEWKETSTFVRASTSHRHRLSVSARASAELNMQTVRHNLLNKKHQVTDSISTRILHVSKYHKRVQRALDDVERQSKLLKGDINKLDKYISERFTWPRKCNAECIRFRNQRIGIDKVVDQVEIALGKEMAMLESLTTKELEPVLLEMREQMQELQLCHQLLTEDRSRKEENIAVDKRVRSLHPLETSDELGEVQTRPETAITLPTWKQSIESLFDKTIAAVSQARKLRKEMINAMNFCSEELRIHQQSCLKALEKAKARADKAIQSNHEILEKTRDEIHRVEEEIEKLTEAISNQDVPLKMAATRLRERAHRPEEERTLDGAHKALISEVAELEAAVATLTGELEINANNRLDLLQMVAMLEEDQTIKKQTAYLEHRCIKARSYLNDDTDPFFIKKLVEEQSFFELHTK